MFFIAGMLGMGACSGTHEPPHDHAVPATPAPARADLQLDVPGLLGLSIDEMARQVGPRQRVPADFKDPTLAPLVQRSEHLDSTTLFQRRGLVMVASYDYHSREVRDLLLLGSNENELMRRAQLRLGEAHYLVLPVFQERRPTELLGLRVLALAGTE